ncbi:hypothetical protein LTR95_016749, partial [Oleoguttula sp. CCFEE 5521]
MPSATKNVLALSRTSLQHHLGGPDQNSTTSRDVGQNVVSSFYTDIAAVGDHAFKRQKVALKYRDLCLDLRELAEDTAAGLAAQIFQAVSDTSGSSKPEREKWAQFHKLLRDASNSTTERKKRERRKADQERLAITAAWGPKIRDYYGFHVLVGKWEDAIPLFNFTLADRHCDSFIDGDNNVPSIGVHPATLKTVTHTSPLLPRDFKNLYDYLSSPESLAVGEREQLVAYAKQPRGLPLSKLDLDYDEHGILKRKLSTESDRSVRGCKRNRDSDEYDYEWLSRKRTQLRQTVDERARERTTKLGRAFVEYKSWNAIIVARTAIPESCVSSSPQIDSHIEPAGQESLASSSISGDPDPARDDDTASDPEPNSAPDTELEADSEPDTELEADSEPDTVRSALQSRGASPIGRGPRIEEILEDEVPARGPPPWHAFSEFDGLKADYIKALRGSKSRELALQRRYLEKLAWATVYIDPTLFVAGEARPSGLVDEDDADIVILSVPTFRERANHRDEAGSYIWNPDRPYIVREQFSDSSTFGLPRFLQLLKARSSRDSRIDVRNSTTGKT